MKIKERLTNTNMCLHLLTFPGWILILGKHLGLHSKPGAPCKSLIQFLAPVISPAQPPGESSNRFHNLADKWLFCKMLFTCRHQENKKKMKGKKTG